MRSGSPPGWPKTPPMAPSPTGSACTGQRRPVEARRPRSTARSRSGSKATTRAVEAPAVVADRPWSRRSPATTWALVTTRSGGHHEAGAVLHLAAGGALDLHDRAGDRVGGGLATARSRPAAGRAPGVGRERVEDVGEVVGADERLQRLHGVGRRRAGWRRAAGRPTTWSPGATTHPGLATSTGSTQPHHHDEAGAARRRPPARRSVVPSTPVAAPRAEAAADDEAERLAERAPRRAAARW